MNVWNTRLSENKGLNVFIIVFIVIILTILINLDPIDGLLKFKEIPAFYDIEADKSTFLFLIYIFRIMFV